MPTRLGIGNRQKALMMLCSLAGLALMTCVVRAHCDTEDGPVVTAGKAALESGELTPALRWVRAADEGAVRDAFARARVVRKQGTEARSLADQFFLETLVRLHRAGEGEPFEGIKPAGAEADPAVAATDRALKGGNADALVNLVVERVSQGVRARFAEAAEAAKQADDSVESGRRFVKAYVEFIHYVEAIYRAASLAHGAGDAREASAEPHR
jgi:hypothetical protein